MDEIIDVNTMFGPLPVAAADLSVDELSEMMQTYGVRACCTLSTVGMLLDHTSGNGATRAACNEHQSLVPTATVNPQAVFSLDGQFTRFRADGFRLVRFFPSEQGWDATYAPMRQLAKALERESLPIMIDVDSVGAATRFSDALGSHPAPLILSGINHTSLAEAIALMRTNERLYVESSRLVAVGAISAVVDSVGSERILYGSGAPSRPMSSALGVLKHASLKEADRANILGANARRLLGI